MSIKHDFCCDSMESGINDKDWVIEYNRVTKSYLLSCRDYITLEMKYCLFCGTKLPKDLNDELHDILVEELGIKSPDYGNNDPRIPPEFKTDEWWKKRGLQQLSRGWEFYRFDQTHKDIEIYNSKARDLGSKDPVTGKIYTEGTMKVNKQLEGMLK